MKVAICVVSHPNDLNKNYILKDLGNFLNQFNYPTFLFTNYPSTQEAQHEFTASFFTNNNPEGPFKGSIWKHFPALEAYYYKTINNWCFSGTNCLLEGIKILKALDYTHFIFFSYDTETNFEKVKNIIDLSLNYFNTYKGIFYEYSKNLTDLVNLLSTTQCACEVDFFIDIFSKALQNYNNKERSLCEPFWFDALSNNLSEVIILPKELELRTFIDSGKINLLNESNYWLGYSPQKDQTILTYQFPFIDNLKIYKEDIEISYIEETYGGVFKVICFTSDPFSKYYISYENKPKEFLFEDIPSWRSHNYYKF
jgi:hypothetical protein